ncbi:type II toxin-antitoxin system RelE/ParE family toxin [uncultured Roseibium sp.]|uniref:type II toxin-antitoxin system RelE/ParE family toxin n=1 Tax=uncultured Roseibium sp. TaxID=1936171 RepID=UPI0026253F4C|nr:type II toxin-antitoxin system RelE/ParE family toxin [uncultured Roseibium sp.]
MGEYRLTQRALRDLDAIADYSLDQWGAAQTQTYLEQIAVRMQWLADNPGIGKNRDEVADGYRSFPEGKHVIFYLILEAEIAIIGVPHAAMDIDVEKFT